MFSDTFLKHYAVLHKFRCCGNRFTGDFLQNDYSCYYESMPFTDMAPIAAYQLSLKGFLKFHAAIF
jgi:hypothetical protein